MEIWLQWTEFVIQGMYRYPEWTLAVLLTLCAFLTVLIYRKFRQSLAFKHSKEKLLEELIQFVEIEEFFRSQQSETRQPQHS